MEQRAPGHTVLDDKIYKKGFLDFQRDIRTSIDALDFHNDPAAFNKREQLRAMDIAAAALIVFAGRYADKLKSLAAAENDAAKKLMDFVRGPQARLIIETYGYTVPED